MSGKEEICAGTECAGDFAGSFKSIQGRWTDMGKGNKKCTSDYEEGHCFQNKHDFMWVCYKENEYDYDKYPCPYDKGILHVNYR